VASERRHVGLALRGLCALALMIVLAPAQALVASPRYAWLDDTTGDDTLATRVRPPEGYERISVREGSFASWLRDLPVRAPGARVHLYDGRVKRSQAAVFAVIDIDVGSKDLQQCADAVIRLRAEYLRQAGCADRIAFDFTSGDRARWRDWEAGRRPVVSGNEVTWVQKAGRDGSYAAFREYLDTVFMYAGSYSLSRELEDVDDPSRVMPGDVFVHGGFPGHAVLVVDVAENAQGDREFLLAQGFTPAQDLHVLKNLSGPDSPWYAARDEGRFRTPEWTFSYGELKRFPRSDCVEAPSVDTAR